MNSSALPWSLIAYTLNHPSLHPLGMSVASTAVPTTRVGSPPILSK
jgi:hypothetical protein